MLIEWSPPPVKLWIEYPHKPIMWIKRTIPLYKKKSADGVGFLTTKP